MVPGSAVVWRKASVITADDGRTAHRGFCPQASETVRRQTGRGDMAESFELLPDEMIADLRLAVVLDLHDVGGFANGYPLAPEGRRQIRPRVDEFRRENLSAFLDQFVGVVVSAVNPLAPSASLSRK